ncbi:HAMP domain-containing sensor histidine kinase [Actinoplanes sp. NPDC026670]|uniref:GAF domain-containing sensor histidine kinase n=1 Tax=Actinoplanes sp. NPDC026670 TaxID=3154700 RepID=UPI0033C11EE5
MKDAAQYRLALSDTTDLLELVADACRVPMAGITIAEGAWSQFTALRGLPGNVTVPVSKSLYGMVSVNDDAVVVGDATRDPRVRAHPLVAGAAQVRFLAAAPLHYRQRIVGALCVFDSIPRTDDLAAVRQVLGRLARRIDVETGLRDQLTRQQAIEHMVGSDDVVAAISHEIRTPLLAIQGSLELLTDTPGAVAAGFEHRIDVINRNAGRLCRTVDNLLRTMNYGRYSPQGQRRQLDASDCVRNVVARLHPTAAVRLHVQTPDHPVLLTADRILMEIAIEQLLSNALGFSPTEQPVSIVVTDSPYPSITIRDHGPGLDDGELEQVGSLFYRGTHARSNELPGLGLGLNIARRITEAHGGTMRIRSVPGQGTEAELVFPDDRERQQ